MTLCCGLIRPFTFLDEGSRFTSATDYMWTRRAVPVERNNQLRRYDDVKPPEPYPYIGMILVWFCWAGVVRRFVCCTKERVLCCWLGLQLHIVVGVMSRRGLLRGYQLFCPEDGSSRQNIYFFNFIPNKCTQYVKHIIHSLAFSLRGRAGRNQSPVMSPVWLWHTASWASSWG